ncbi:MAG: MBL fold metallo-hydrolase [Candidatus Azambacteria bacterium]|nr:MBL fold metallo-hydrolase [Candidatus Azambacteria bacterium]
MKLYFYGAARSVTGANYLLEVGGEKNKTKILIDCGMSQGSRMAEKENYENFPYVPEEIQALLVTHAHIDHTGRIPKIYHDGFRGKIYGTPPTLDFAKLLLLDSEHIIKYEAEKQGIKPLYAMEDVEGASGLFEKIDYHKEFEIGPDITAEFLDAGHILGSSIIRIKAEGKTIVFSGDLGNPPTPLLAPTEFVARADYVVIESAYGDRLHEDRVRRKEILEETIEYTIGKGGTIMIPAFAMERTQELLYELNNLVENKLIPPVPIFLDSPLAINATAIYKKYPEYYGKEAKHLSASDEIFDFPNLKFTLSTEDSKKINDISGPKIIIAGSGMSTAGRILHHERRYLSDPNSMLLIIGYQTVGSLGRRILDGEKEVRIMDENVSVRCNVKAIGGYSAHADQAGLKNWISRIERPIKKVFVVQGEEAAELALQKIIKKELSIDAEAPEMGDVFEL